MKDNRFKLSAYVGRVGLSIITAPGLRADYTLSPDSAILLGQDLIRVGKEAKEHGDRDKAQKIIEIEAKIALLRKEQEQLLGHPPAVVEPFTPEIGSQFDEANALAEQVRIRIENSMIPMVPRHSSGFKSFES